MKSDLLFDTIPCFFCRLASALLVDVGNRLGIGAAEEFEFAF